ncbi:glycosyl hydrolase [Aureococcus anophagefferens]|nr:glycosyl hydrolase [Aureococcus anophagefferens]
MVVGAWLFASLWTLAHGGDERPQFHFNFLQDNGTDIVNDPNGPRYIDGLYHLFFQHRRLPSYTEIAHATSPDLLHWTMAPRAVLEPDEPYDDAGVWSNSFELPDGRVGLAYRARSRAPTAAGAAVAVADDGVAGNWTKRGVLFPKATCDALPIWRSKRAGAAAASPYDGAAVFTAESVAGAAKLYPVDYGTAFAGSTMWDPVHGRRIYMAWVGGKTNAHVWPREFTVEDGAVRFRPIREALRLRTPNASAAAAYAVDVVDATLVDGLQQLGVEATFARRRPDLGREFQNGAAGSESYAALALDGRGGPFVLPPRSATLALRVLVDHALVEAFADGRASVTTFRDDDDASATKVSLFSTCADVAAASGRAWEMASAPVVGPL